MKRGKATKKARWCSLCGKRHPSNEGTPGYSCDRPRNEGGNR